MGVMYIVLKEAEFVSRTGGVRVMRGVVYLRTVEALLSKM